jgi:DNA (cytosine-5)-methyltransferase 1
MKVLDLFSGIGGFSLGLERAGMQTVAFCEIDAFARRALAKHWPEVPIYDDVRTLTGNRLRADGIIPDVICGGFPCQDISVAGGGAGLAGARSGLWSEYARLVGELRPRWVVIENVAALLGRGHGAILGDLAALGFDAEWHCIPASAVGAPHRRDRIWIVAYPDSGGRREQGHERGEAGDARAGQSEYSREGLSLAVGAGLALGPGTLGERAHAATARGGAWDAQPGMGRALDGAAAGLDGIAAWESDSPRTVTRGYPDRRQRLIALGNAVVPQIPELIGRAIMAVEARA